MDAESWLARWPVPRTHHPSGLCISAPTLSHGPQGHPRIVPRLTWDCKPPPTGAGRREVRVCRVISASPALVSGKGPEEPRRDVRCQDKCSSPKVTEAPQVGSTSPSARNVAPIGLSSREKVSPSPFLCSSVGVTIHEGQSLGWSSLT